MSQPPKPRVLLVCYGNACRSQMGEAILRHDAGDWCEACSAGTRPAGFVHPIAEEAMESLGISMEGQFSKGMESYAGMELDVVVTLCDYARAGLQPVWAGSPVQVHWPLPDPSFHEGTPEQRRSFALAVATDLRGRLQVLADCLRQGARGGALRRELAVRLGR